MNTLDRYVALTIAMHFGVALMVLMAIFSVINVMEELDHVGTASYDMARALWFVLLKVPSEAYELMPAAALLGSVNALGSLASRNELVAIAAAGVSQRRLIGSVMKLAAVLVLCAFAAGELVAAPLAQRAETDRSIALSGGVALSTANGFWTRDGSSFVNIRSTLPGGQLQDVFIYDFDDRNRMRSFTYAKTAVYANRGWRAEGLVEGQITEDGVVTRHVPRRFWRKFLQERQLRILLVAPEYVPLPDLVRSIPSLRRRSESTLRNELVLWERLTRPVVAAIMIFLAVPLVVAGLGATKRGQRTVVAALAGVGFQMLNQTFGRFGMVFGLPAALSATLPAVLVLGAGLWLLTRNS